MKCSLITIIQGSSECVRKEHFTLLCYSVVLGAVEIAQLVNCLQSSIGLEFYPQNPCKQPGVGTRSETHFGELQVVPEEQTQGLELWPLHVMCMNVHTPSQVHRGAVECSSLLMIDSL